MFGNIWTNRSHNAITILDFLYACLYAYFLYACLCIFQNFICDFVSGRNRLKSQHFKTLQWFTCFAVYLSTLLHVHYIHRHTTVSYHAGGLCTWSYVCSNTQTHAINTFYRLLKLYSLQTTNKTPDHDMTKELISFKTFLVFFLDCRRVFVEQEQSFKHTR